MPGLPQILGVQKILKKAEKGIDKMLCIVYYI